MITPNTVLLTKEDLYSLPIYIYYRYRNKDCGGELILTKEDVGLFTLDNRIHVLIEYRKEFVEEKYQDVIDKIFECKILNVKGKEYLVKKRHIPFNISVFMTNTVRMGYRKKIKRKKSIETAKKRLDKVFSKNYYLRLYSKNGNVIIYIKLLEAFFIGNGDKIQIANKFYSDSFFHIDKRFLIRKVVYDEKFRKHIFFVFDMLEEITNARKSIKEACNVLYPIIFEKNSELYNLLKIVRKYYKEK